MTARERIAIGIATGLKLAFAEYRMQPTPEMRELLDALDALREPREVGVEDWKAKAMHLTDLLRRMEANRTKRERWDWQWCEACECYDHAAECEFKAALDAEIKTEALKQSAEAHQQTREELSKLRAEFKTTKLLIQEHEFVDGPQGSDRCVFCGVEQNWAYRPRYERKPTPHYADCRMAPIMGWPKREA